MYEISGLYLFDKNTMVRHLIKGTAQSETSHTNLRLDFLAVSLQFFSIYLF